MKFLVTLLSLFIAFPSTLTSPSAQVGSILSDAEIVLGDPGAVVPLRIEGIKRTIFEGPIFTRGHNITTPSGGNHHCDGTNNGTHPYPGPTATTALADAANEKGFSFDATFFDSIDDFFITCVDGDCENKEKGQFWGFRINFVQSRFGGCQTQVTPSTHVLWAYDAFGTYTFLTLDGPKTAVLGQTVTLTVRNGSNNALNPIEGATVGGETTGADGTVKVKLNNKGLIKFKAEKEGTIRSNAVDILVV